MQLRFAAILATTPALVFGVAIGNVWIWAWTTGCSDFHSGETCTLNEALHFPDPDNTFNSTGQVKVQVSQSSVKFTVTSDNYFDARGSTIEFLTCESHGDLYLQQIADASSSEWWAKLGIAEGGASHTWNTQADNLRKLLGSTRV